MKRVANAGGVWDNELIAAAPSVGTSLFGRYEQMSNGAEHKVTRLLNLAVDGDRRATEELLPVIYDELRRMARAQLDREKPGQTLQPTALVHEAFLRLVGDGDVQWNSRAHFFGAAAQAMRRILVDRARQRATVKHGGGLRRVELDDSKLDEEPDPGVMLALDEVLAKLEAFDKAKAQIVMLRFFAGLTFDQIATAVGTPASTVKDEWSYARAWMHREMTRGSSVPG